MAQENKGPPREVPASELFLKLTQSPRPRKAFEYDKRADGGEVVKVRVQLVPLTEKELMQCRASAEAYARVMLKDDKPHGDGLGYADIYRNALFVEFVTRSCRSTESVNLPVFPSSAHVREWLFPDEIAVLFEAASLWQTECGPIVSQMSDGEMEAWVKRLAEGASSVPLALLSSEAKNDLIRFMASRLTRSSTASGSAGSPPGEPSPSSASAPSDDPPLVEMLDDEVPPAPVKD